LQQQINQSIQQNMKKVIALAFVAGMFSLVSCGPSAEEKAAEEKRQADSVAAADAAMKAAEEAAAAAAAATVDTTAMDSTATADSTAKK
jgi:hypothetical protein